MTQKKPIRRFFIAGLLVLLPIVATFLVIRILVDFMDRSLSLLPHSYQPDTILGFHIPGLGVILSIVVVFLTGIIATNIFGRRLVALGEAILARIPLVRSIYNAVKQVSETMFASDSKAFRKVVLIEYPRKGLWSIALQTSTDNVKNNKNLNDDMVTIFLPTTPNPTSGFLLLVPRKDITELEMSIDEALKMIISLGVVQPESINGLLNSNKGPIDLNKTE